MCKCLQASVVMYLFLVSFCPCLRPTTWPNLTHDCAPLPLPHYPLSLPLPGLTFSPWCDNDNVNIMLSSPSSSQLCAIFVPPPWPWPWPWPTLHPSPCSTTLALVFAPWYDNDGGDMWYYVVATVVSNCVPFTCSGHVARPAQFSFNAEANQDAGNIYWQQVWVHQMHCSRPHPMTCQQQWLVWVHSAHCTVTTNLHHQHHQQSNYSWWGCMGKHDMPAECTCQAPHTARWCQQQSQAHRQGCGGNGVGKGQGWGEESDECKWWWWALTRQAHTAPHILQRKGHGRQMQCMKQHIYLVTYK